MSEIRPRHHCRECGWCDCTPPVFRECTAMCDEDCGCPDYRDPED